MAAGEPLTRAQKAALVLLRKARARGDEPHGILDNGATYDAGHGAFVNYLTGRALDRRGLAKIDRFLSRHEINLLPPAVGEEGNEHGD